MAEAGARTGRARPTWSRRAAAEVAVVGVVLVVVLVFVALGNAVVPPPEAKVTGYTTPFSPPTTPFEVILLRGDGQAYATLARDPLLSSGTEFVAGPPQAAYFAQRPLLVYGVWLLSLGSPERFLPAFILMTVLGAVALLVGAVALIQRASPRRDPRVAILLLCLPGSVIAIQWLAHEVLATGLAVGAVAAWLAPRRRWWAAVLLTAAVLTRESMVLVGVVLGIATLAELVRAGPGDRGDRVRDLAALSLAPVCLVAWFALVRVRYGDPGANATRNFGLPFTGMVGQMGGWGSSEYVVLALGVVLVGLALWRSPGHLTTWVAVAYLAFGLVLGKPVWFRTEDFARVLLPLYAFAALGLLVVPSWRGSAGGAGPGSSASSVDAAEGSNGEGLRFRQLRR